MRFPTTVVGQHIVYQYTFKNELDHIQFILHVATMSIFDNALANQCILVHGLHKVFDSPQSGASTHFKIYFGLPSVDVQLSQQS